MYCEWISGFTSHSLRHETLYCEWISRFTSYSLRHEAQLYCEWISRFKVRSHCAICSASKSSFIHAFLRNCSHHVMGLDAICNVLTLESHITIAWNRYRTHSRGTSHTGMHRMQSKLHHVNSVINNHAIQFLFLKNRSRTSHRVNEALPLTHCELNHQENYCSSITANLIPCLCLCVKVRSHVTFASTLT